MRVKFVSKQSRTMESLPHQNKFSPCFDSPFPLAQKISLKKNLDGIFCEVCPISANYDVFDSKISSHDTSKSVKSYSII